MQRYLPCILGLLTLSITGCKDQSSPTTELTVISNDAYSTIFAANIGQTAQHTYLLTVNDSVSLNSGSQTFDIIPTLPSGFSVGATTCQNVYLGQTCEMTILFTPVTNSNYLQSGVISFNANGALSKQLAIQAIPATQIIATENDPADSHKTDIMLSVAGGTPVIAEMDTGSEMLVVTQAAVGPNITMTQQQVTLDYGQGQNILTGYLGYGPVSFTTTSGQTLTTSSNTPIVVVPAIPQGDYQVILGMGLRTQAAARLYLPYPYNQMFLIDHTGRQLIFGTWTQAQIDQFATYQLNALPGACANSGATTLSTPICWNDQAVGVNYNINTGPSQSENITYPTLMDSGASNGSFQFPTAPSWAHINGNQEITNLITPILLTSQGEINLPFPQHIYYVESDANKVNLGNAIFAQFKVFYDQIDGIIGLQADS